MGLVSKRYNLEKYQTVRIYKQGNIDEDSAKLYFAKKRGKSYVLLTSDITAKMVNSKDIQDGDWVAVPVDNIFNARKLSLEDVKNFEDYINYDKFRNDGEMFD